MLKIRKNIDGPLPNLFADETRKIFPQASTMSSQFAEKIRSNTNSGTHALSDWTISLATATTMAFSGFGLVRRYFEPTQEAAFNFIKSRIGRSISGKEAYQIALQISIKAKKDIAEQRVRDASYYGWFDY